MVSTDLVVRVRAVGVAPTVTSISTVLLIASHAYFISSSDPTDLLAMLFLAPIPHWTQFSLNSTHLNPYSFGHGVGVDPFNAAAYAVGEAIPSVDYQPGSPSGYTGLLVKYSTLDGTTQPLRCVTLVTLC